MATLQSRHIEPQIQGPPGGANQKRKLIDTPTQAPSSVATSNSGTPNLQFSPEPESLLDGSNSESGDIPEAKRRAQNRAAQRAFRERKEKHLKELENRLAELENESRSWKTTNMALRNKLNLLENELQHYRWSDSKPGVSAPPKDGFSSPALPAHMLPYDQHNQPKHNPHNQTPQHRQQHIQPPHRPQHNPPHSHPHSHPHNIQHNLQSKQPNPADPRPLQPQIPSPAHALSPESAPALSTDSSSSGGAPNRADDFCAKLSTACVVNTKKIAEDAPFISADHPGWQKDALYGRNSNVEYWLQNGTNGKLGGVGAPPIDAFDYTRGTQPPQPQHAGFADTVRHDAEPFADPLNLDFGTMDAGFSGFGKGDEGDANGAVDFMGLLNNDFGVFDPLDGMLEWNPPKQDGAQPQSHPAVSQHTQDAQQKQPRTVAPNSQQLAPQLAQQPYPSTAPASQLLGQHSPLFSPPSAESRSPLVGAYDDSIDKATDEQVPSASQKFIQCADVWDRICSHPRFGEIDINSMCQELRNKARCSKTGVVLDEQDVNAVLGTLR